jgi:PPOX class probable F420-dependent enzyme
MSERDESGATPGLRLPPSAVGLINGPALGHVVSLDPDGSPHVTGVWLGMDGDDIVFASMYAWRKTKNLMRDERVAISVESDGFHASGLREYLVVRGRVEVVEGGAFALLRRLAETYMGPGVAFPPDELAGRTGYVMRVRVDEINGVGPWTGAPPGLPDSHGGTT